MINTEEFKMNEALQTKLNEAKAGMGANYCLHPDYKMKKHHSFAFKQSHTLMKFLVERGAIMEGRV